MIIIFNLSGLLIGALGVFFGILVAGGLATAGSPLWLCPGLLGIAGVWWVYGCSKPDLKTGEMRPAPSIFFIPLRYWGLVVALLSFPMGLVELVAPPGANQAGGGAVANDPRKQQFDELEKGLSHNQTDDDELSALLTVMIAKVMPGEPVNVAIKSSDSSVLVLMKLKDLKKIKDENRKVLLNGIRELAESRRPDVKVFAGIRGKLLFGAVTTPGHPDQVGAVVDEEPLLAFFDPPPAPQTDSKPEISEPTPTEETKPQPESDSTKPAEGELSKPVDGEK